MTAPVGLIEVEEAEAPEVDAALLAEKVPARRCKCGSVKLGDQVRHDETGCRPIVFAAVEKVPYPAPEVNSRDCWDRTDAPSPVAKLAEKARKAGWRVKAQRSRGCLPHATHGTPGAVKTLHALVLSNDYASAYAVYDGTGWSSIMLWGSQAPWFPSGTVTDLADYLTCGGRVNDGWFDAIRNRETSKVARTKAREACNRGVHAGAALADGRWTCETCGNSWGAREAAWRKPKTRKTEAN